MNKNFLEHIIKILLMMVMEIMRTLTIVMKLMFSHYLNAKEMNKNFLEHNIMILVIVMIIKMTLTIRQLSWCWWSYSYHKSNFTFQGDEQELPGAQHQEAVEQRLGDWVQLALQTCFQVKLSFWYKFSDKTFLLSEKFHIRIFLWCGEACDSLSLTKGKSWRKIIEGGVGGLEWTRLNLSLSSLRIERRRNRLFVW